MKKIISFILTICLVLCAFPVCSFALTDGDFEYIIEDGRAVVTGYIGYNPTCEVPSTLGGKKVIRLGKGLGYSEEWGNNYIVDLIVPDCVEEVTNFGQHDALKTITIKNGGCSVSGFGRCNGLESLVIEDGGKGYGEVNGFSYCENLKTVKLSERTKIIGDGAFSQCPSITEITLPKKLQRLGNNAFTNCGALEKVTIPDTPEKMGNGCFLNCDSLETVNILEGVTELGTACFSGCDGLVTVKTPFGFRRFGPETNYGNDTFNNCSALTNVIISYGPEYIPDMVFDGCIALSEVTIPYSVKTIHRDAFKDSDLTLIKGIKGTAAEQYANFMGIPFEEIEHIYGDLDWNERVEAKDALLALCNTVGTVDFIDYHKVSADVNVDGKVTAADALMILQYSVGLRTVFPAEIG